MPVFPAIALLTAVCLDTAGRRAQLVAAGLLALPGALLLMAVPLALAKGHGGDELREYQPWLIFAGVLLLGGGALAWRHAWRARRDLTVLTMAVAGFCATHLVLAGFEVYGKDRAGADLLPAIRAELTPKTKLYAVHGYEQSMTYYLERTMILVEYGDEFTFGLQQQPELTLRRLDDFIAQWRSDAAVGVPDMAILAPAPYEALRQRGLPMRVVAQDRRRFVISNQLSKERP